MLSYVNIYACISVVGDFILIWQQHQLYVYLIVQSLLVLIVFFSVQARTPARVRKSNLSTFEHVEQYPS